MINKFLIYVVSLRHLFVTRFLSYILNEHMRRMIFIASLHAQIKDIKQPDKDLIDKLGDVMSLSLKYKEAPKLAMYVSGKIWHENININCHSGVCFQINNLKDIGMLKLNGSQIRIISDQILKTIPEWLRYGSNRVMKKDVVRLLSNLQTI